jgi:hypothetical protein
MIPHRTVSAVVMRRFMSMTTGITKPSFLLGRPTCANEHDAWIGYGRTLSSSTSSLQSSSVFERYRHRSCFFSSAAKAIVDDDVDTKEKDGHRFTKKPSATGEKEQSSSTLPSSSEEATSTVVGSLPCNFGDISRARVAIRGGVKRTECTKSYFLSELIGANIYLKFENQQFTGSFKERGARNAILQLIRERGSDLKGVIAASAGNHALALAYHGRELGIPVTVVMPVVAPLAKVDKCRKFGANVVIDGNHILEAKKTAEDLIASNPGLQYINGFDDPPIIAGAGTIGQEIVEDVPDVDAVIVPVGGAGLIAGVSCAVKTLKPDCKVRTMNEKNGLKISF